MTNAKSQKRLFQNVLILTFPLNHFKWYIYMYGKREATKSQNDKKLHNLLELSKKIETPPILFHNNFSHFLASKIQLSKNRPFFHSNYSLRQIKSEVNFKLQLHPFIGPVLVELWEEEVEKSSLEKSIIFLVTM